MPSPTTIEPIIPPATGPPTPPEEEADELAAEAPAGEAVMVNGALATTAGGPAAAASDATGRFAALATAETTVVKAGAVGGMAASAACMATAVACEPEGPRSTVDVKRTPAEPAPPRRRPGGTTVIEFVATSVMLVTRTADADTTTPAPPLATGSESCAAKAELTAESTAGLFAMSTVSEAPLEGATLKENASITLGVHARLPAGELLPAGQARQTELASAVPAAVWNVLAGHSAQGMQTVDPGVLE